MAKIISCFNDLFRYKLNGRKLEPKNIEKALKIKKKTLLSHQQRYTILYK